MFNVYLISSRLHLKTQYEIVPRINELKNSIYGYEHVIIDIYLDEWKWSKKYFEQNILDIKNALECIHANMEASSKVIFIPKGLIIRKLELASQE